jgi:hypothetical protein
MSALEEFRNASVFLMQQLLRILEANGIWDNSAGRFRSAWGDPSFTIQERQSVFHKLYETYRVQFLSDGYTWLCDNSITLNIEFVSSDSGVLELYGSFPIGSGFKTLQLQKIEARLEDNAEKEQSVTNEEMMLYRALLVCVYQSLDSSTRDFVLIQKMAEQYEQETQDGNGSGNPADNPLFAKMAGSANGLLNMIVGVTEGNDSVPPAIKNTLKGIQEKMADGGLQNPENLMAMMTEMMGEGGITKMMGEMGPHMAGNPMVENILGLLTRPGSFEEKAAAISDITNDPALLNELKKEMM